MVVHVCIPGVRRLVLEGHKFKAILKYTVGLCLNKRSIQRERKRERGRGKESKRESTKILLCQMFSKKLES